MKEIIIKGAREHNLKNINLKIPRDKFTVITGLSGSGKSTLAFNTIYAEGQRRYVESLSAYARQFLENLNKPDIDSIEGLSPAISIEQKTTSKNPRSTVGTVTEIYDYLRLLFARIGVSHCPKCDSLIRPQSSENISNLIMADLNKKIAILSPIIIGQKGTYEKVIENLQKEGFAKIRIDGIIYDINLAKELKLTRYKRHWIEAVIDRIKITKHETQRINDSCEQALVYGKGDLIILDLNKQDEIISKIKNKFSNLENRHFSLNEKNIKQIQREAQISYSTYGACQNHPEYVFVKLEPRQFSFNSPFGACQNCLGLGIEKKISEDLIIQNKNKSIMDGAIGVYGKMDLKWRLKQISSIGEIYGFDIFTPLNKFSKEQLDILLYGNSNKPIKTKWHNGAVMRQLENGWEGLIPQTNRLYLQTDSEKRKFFIEKFMISKKCSKCCGQRLKETILFVKINKMSIIDLTNLSIENLSKFFENLNENLNEKEKFIAKQILKEINDRLNFLNSVGLSYLNLSRSAGTLSGGEAQRIRLATQIGSNLMGVLYILDEPSIGLHQRDNKKLINTLHKLRDIGNTLIVVEHDEDTILSADYVIDIGPGAGIHGGEIVAKGKPQEIKMNNKSLTGKYLSKQKQIKIPKKRRYINIDY